MERLAPELPGILAWGVQGCLDWLKFGLGTPDEVKEATGSYRGEMDVIGAFIDECCVISKIIEVTATEIYKAYTKWAESNGEKPIAQKSFGLRLEERGFHKGRGTGGTRKWAGIGLQTFSGSDMSDA